MRNGWLGQRSWRIEEHSMSDIAADATVSVRVLPVDVVFEVRPGETVFLAAARLGYSWPTICGGVAECGSCISNVTEGVDNCLPPATNELEAIARVRPGRHQHDPAFRLACQLQVTGPVTLTKRGVRPLA